MNHVQLTKTMHSNETSCKRPCQDNLERQKLVPCDKSGNSWNGVVESGQHALHLPDVDFTLT